MEGVLQRADRFRRKTAPAQANDVETDHACTVTRHHRERGGILAQFGISSAHGGFTNAAELMHTRKGTENRVVLKSDVARKPARPRNDAMASDLTVVRDVGVVHDEVVVTNARTTPTALGTDVDSRELADLIVAADFKGLRLAVRNFVLRLAADARVRVQTRARTDSRSPMDRSVGVETNPSREPDFRPDHAERADTDVIRQLRARVYDSGADARAET